MKRIAAFSALLLMSGAALADESWTSTGQMSSDSVEAGGPGFLGGDTLASEQYNERFPSNGSESPIATEPELLSGEEPSADTELPLGG
jgi:hypothetical protein